MVSSPFYVETGGNYVPKREKRGSLKDRGQHGTARCPPGRKSAAHDARSSTRRKATATPCSILILRGSLSAWRLLKGTVKSSRKASTCSARASRVSRRLLAPALWGEAQRVGKPGSDGQQHPAGGSHKSAGPGHHVPVARKRAVVWLRDPSRSCQPRFIWAIFPHFFGIPLVHVSVSFLFRLFPYCSKHS
jgi:hypothetical protein